MRPEPGIGIYIKMLSDCVQQKANNSLMSQNLTFAQSKILVFLSERTDGTATLKELQAKVHSAQSTVCGLISRMEKKGLIENVPTPGDKRVKRVRLTSQGIRVSQWCKQDMRQTDQWITQALSAEEREQLIALLKRICEQKRRTLGQLDPHNAESSNETY